MTDHLFISYSRIDGAALAARVAAALAEGEPQWTVWTDRTEIPAGSDFTVELDDAIRRCRCVVYLMTPDSVSSASFCRNEIARAGRYKKPVVPVLASTHATPPIGLETAQHIDLTGDQSVGLAALRAHLVWTETPAGEFSGLKYRRAGLEREMGRASRDDQRRVEEEIARVDRRMRELEAWLADPERASRAATTRIVGGVDVVRHAADPAAARATTRFVNSAAFVPPLHFQDRHAETKLAVEFLRNPDKRLLTIVGRGGVGKTGMAARLLKGIENGGLPDDLGELPVAGIVYLSEQRSRRVSFPHLYEDLVRLLDPVSTERAEAAYRSPHGSAAAKMEALLPLLPSGTIVVLLDNFEDLVGEGRVTTDRELHEALVAWLHAPPNGLKVIITTRMAPADLAVTAPAACGEIPLDEGLPSPHAEALLMQLDADGAVGFRHAPPGVLAEVAGRVRGYPRAIEALYAVLRNDRNTDLDELLGKAAAVLPERVVEVMVGEAFSRLDRHEQVVMQALAVFGRPVPAVAIDYLLQPFVPAIDAAAVLRWLVDLQIIRRDRDRYYLHPVDAAYALARIPDAAPSAPGDAGPAPLTRRALIGRAAGYFREIRKPADAWHSIQDLEPQLAEFDLRCRAEEYDAAALLLLAIGFQYLRAWGHVRMLVELHERLRGRLTDRTLEANCLGILGTAYWDMGDLARASADLRACIDLTEGVHGPYSGAAWWCDLGCCLRDMGEVEEALAAHERALDIDDHVGDRSGVGTDLNNAAECYGDRGLTDLAAACVTVAIDMIPLTDGDVRGRRRRQAYRLATLARLHLDAGRAEQAGARAQEALDIGIEIGNSEVGARVSYYVAVAAASRGDATGAAAHARASLDHEYPRFRFRALLLLGVAHLMKGERRDAGESFAACVKACEDLLGRSDAHYLARLHLALARCGLYACGQAPDVKGARDALTSCAMVRQYPGIRTRCLHLLRLMAAQDPTRQLNRLALLVEGDAGNAAPPAPPERSVLDHAAVQRLRATLVGSRLAKLHAAGALAEAAAAMADGEAVTGAMSGQELMEFQRVRAWVQARRGFLDGPAILDGIQDPAYVASLLRVTDYMAVYRFRGLTPAAEVGEWYERGCRLAEGAGANSTGASVLLDEYQACALVAAADLAGAERLLQKALAAETAGFKDARILARIQSTLGETYRCLGDAGKAEQLLETAAAFQEEHGFEGDYCEFTLPHLAALHAGGPAPATYLEQARAIAARLGHRKALVRALLMEARLGAAAARRAGILAEATAMAAELPALAACPLMQRILAEWDRWCEGAAGGAADFWGL